MMIAVLFVIVVFSVCAHECAHGATAWYYGDPSAYAAGRVTLNPLKHFDLWGGVVAPLVTWLAVGVPIGWAKSVPIDASGLTKQEFIRVVAAGPFCNLALAGIFLPWMLYAPHFGNLAVGVNLSLAIFNLLPIPGFDGWVILRAARTKGR